MSTTQRHDWIALTSSEAHKLETTLLRKRQTHELTGDDVDALLRAFTGVRTDGERTLIRTWLENRRAVLIDPRHASTIERARNA